MNIRDPRIVELLDRDAIDTVLSTYCRGIDRHDTDLIESAYFPDARDNHGPFQDRVSNGFAEWGNALHAAKTRAHTHNLTTRWVEVTGDVALTDTYVLFVLALKDRPEVELGSGRYLDRLERRAGRWRIAARRTAIDIRMKADARAWLATAGGYGAGAWDRSDPSYQRPLTLPPELAARLADKPTPPRETAPVAHRLETQPADPESRLNWLLARRTVADCIAQSLRGLDRGEHVVARAAFAEDAIVIAGANATPVAVYVDQEVATANGADEAQARHVTTHCARIEGDEAFAETYVIEMRRRRDGTTVWAGGVRLFDRLTRRHGTWRIAQRTLAADWEFASPISSFNPADRYLRSMRGAGDPLRLDARDQPPVSAEGRP